MQTARRSRTRWAIAASALAHACVLTAALMQHFTLAPPSEEAGPPQPIIPILLMPRARLAAAAGAAARPGELRLHRRPQRAVENPLPLAPLPAPETPARPPEPHAEAPAPGPPSPATAPGPAAPDLRAALRHGLAGCANGAATGMTREERERCDDQLATGAKAAPLMPLNLSPRMRAYYDAVAKAKAPDPPLTPQRAPGALGASDVDARGSNGHLPGIGCSIPFGGGVKRSRKERLPHALWLGPCFIEPPKGSLTPEVDIPVP